MAAPQPEEGGVYPNWILASEDAVFALSLSLSLAYIAAPDFPHDRSSVREAEAREEESSSPASHSCTKQPSLRFAILRLLPRPSPRLLSSLSD